jgi:intron-binding protein aquarius
VRRVVILSLTRTSKIGYLRDLRRLTVALSRARLGLYVLGRRQLFEDCFELRDAFALLFERPDELSLVTGEMWPCERQIPSNDGAGDSEDLPNKVVMESLEHLGQYVHEMTRTRAKQLRIELGLPPEEQLGPKSVAQEPYTDEAKPNQDGDDEDGVEREPPLEEGFGEEEA